MGAAGWAAPLQASPARYAVPHCAPRGCAQNGCTSHLPSAATGEFVRRGCTVYLYDHTEYTRNRAFQTLRASLYDHVCRMLSQTALPRESRG